MKPERRLIPAHELRSGSRVFVEPQYAGIPRAARLDAIAGGGQWMQVTDYVHGLVARGAALAWSAEPAPLAAPVLVAVPADEVTSEENDDAA